MFFHHLDSHHHPEHKTPLKPWKNPNKNSLKEDETLQYKVSAAIRKPLKPFKPLNPLTTKRFQDFCFKGSGCKVLSKMTQLVLCHSRVFCPPLAITFNSKCPGTWFPSMYPLKGLGFRARGGPTTPVPSPSKA